MVHVIKNQIGGGDEPRRLITHCDSNGVLVDGTVVGVLHGRTSEAERRPASLIVFEFRFASIKQNRRIKSALITILFAPLEMRSENREYGPEVVGLAPKGAMRLFNTTATTTRTVSGGGGISGGGFFANAGVSWSSQRDKTRDGALRLQGTARHEGRDFGPQNAVVWFIGENELQENGISCTLRCVVLLTLPDQEKYLAHVRIETEASGPCAFFRSLRIPSSKEVDDPLIFNPKREEALQRSPFDRIDRENLGTLIGSAFLNSLAYLRSESEGHPPTAEGLLGPAVNGIEPESTLWTEGSTRDRILLNFSEGQYEHSYKLKRFQTISIFNLYMYQHRIIKLEEDIKSKIKLEEEIDDVKADKLAKLLREYHEAIRGFKELAAFESPTKEMVKATNDALSVKLHEPYYSMDDDTSMIDLWAEPTSDDVRRWVQKLLNKLSGRRSNELPETHPISVGISATADKLAGFLVAFVGGAFLLAPMCELTYVHSQKYQVISVVLWVLFFSIAVAATSRVKNQELLAATAAYAAVLVVFISRN